MAVLALVVIVALALGIRAIISALTTGGEAAASLPVADQPVQIELPDGERAIPLRAAALNDSGRIDPPPDEGIWYTGHDRVAPGELGTAVIVGQAEDDGKPAAFGALTSAGEGDRVTITFGDGVTLELDVVSNQILTEDELADSDLVWGAQQDTHRTVLVTSDTVEQGEREGHVVVVGQLG